MADIHHRLIMSAAPDEVLRAVTQKAIAGARACTIAFGGCDSLAFTHAVLPLRIPDGASSASLRITDGPPAWIGTEIVIAIDASEEGTILRLTHHDLHDADTDALAAETTRWARVLLGLKSFIETPEPEDTRL